jgi:hypothetical protein
MQHARNRAGAAVRSALSLAALLTLAACATNPGSPHQPFGSFVDRFGQPSPPQSGVVNARLVFATQAEIDLVCPPVMSGFAGGPKAAVRPPSCEHPPTSAEPRWVIYVPFPKDWNDPVVCQIGHGFLHERLAEHK